MVPVRWIPAVVGCCALLQGNRPNGINPHYTGLYRNNWWQAAGSFLQPEGQQQKAPWNLRAKRVPVQHRYGTTSGV